MGLLNALRVARASVLAGMAGCTTLLGVDGFRPVDCADRCEEDGGGAPPDASAPEVEAGLDAAKDVVADATDAGCDGHVVEVTLVSGPGAVESDPALFAVDPGETESHCVAAQTRLRLRFVGGDAEWRGAPCEDGFVGDRCEFPVAAPVRVTVTPRGS